jgi:hypothetical protein
MLVERATALLAGPDGGLNPALAPPVLDDPCATDRPKTTPYSLRL